MNNIPCCKCHGSGLVNCTCHCHLQEDCKYWETVAFIWICDAIDDLARLEAWRRFCEAFPEFSHETHEGFWERILKSEWYRKHGHRHHHHHEYDCQ